LKYVFGEGWRISIGLITWEMKKCYEGSRRRGMSYKKKYG